MRHLFLPILLTFTLLPAPVMAEFVDDGPPAWTDESTGPAFDARPLITVGQLNKLSEYSRRRGTYRLLNRAQADVLRISFEDNASMRQLSINNAGTRLFFAQLGNREGYFFAESDGNVEYYFHLDWNLQLVAAATASPRQAPKVPAADVQLKQLPGTITPWARFADRLMDGGRGGIRPPAPETSQKPTPD